MPKIMVFVTLNNKLTNEILKKTYDGFLTEEKIIYKEETRVVTILRNSNMITMIRKEGNDTVTLQFTKGKKTTSSLEIKGLDNIQIDTITTELEQGEKKFHICYQTKIGTELMGEYDLKLHYEVRK